MIEKSYPLTLVHQSGLPLAYIFAETPEERESLAADLKPVAEKHRGKVNFATIDAAAFGQHASNLNLEVGTWPAFAIQDISKNQKYPFTKQGAAKDISKKAIGAFVEEFVEGKIEPSIKSEPVPEKQEPGATVIVAKSYQDLVIDNDKDVLLEFYAPWCGHCKALAPKYDELAEKYAAFSDKVTIAKIDATTNDVPDDISGFPTIKLFKAGSKDEPIEYSGARSVEALAEFVRDNGSHKVAIPEEEAAEGVETDGMPQQAAAASGVKDKVAEAAEVVKEAIFNEDEPTDSHDEL